MILVAGDLMVDVFVLPELHEAEQPEGLLIRGGGSAANTAAWVAALGEPVTFVGAVGDDAPGRMLVDELQHEGVVPRVRTVSTEPTGAVLVNVTSEGERIMRSSRGANMALAPDNLRAAEQTECSNVHITGYALLGPYGLSLLEAAARLAHAQNALLSFDPSSPGVVKAIGREELRQALRELGVGVLMPNAEEALCISRATEVHAAARDLAQLTPAVVIKNGPEGAIAAQGQLIIDVPTPPRAPRDTTGAGDAFNGGALVGLSRGRSIAEACEMGNESAGRVITWIGGRPRDMPGRAGTVGV